MSRWWRAYDEALDDAKLLLLSDRQHRGWFSLMCLASAYGGTLPEIKIVAIKLRMSAVKAAELITRLVKAGLIDESETGFSPHNWSTRQYKSDVTDPTAAGRMKRYRKNRKSVTANTVTVTPPREQITETERKEDTASAVSSSVAPYAFESGVIRLRQKDFDQWKQAFSHLDLGAELLALTEWAGQQGQKWFFAVSSALAKKNREIGVRLEQQKTAPAYKWNGMEGVT